MDFSTHHLCIYTIVVSTHITELAEPIFCRILGHYTKVVYHYLTTQRQFDNFQLRQMPRAHAYIGQTNGVHIYKHIHTYLLRTILPLEV